MRILVIDDSATVRRTLAEALRDAGTVETVAKASRAFELLRQGWDWIIADASLPDTTDDQLKWLSDLRDATDAQIIINSVNDSPEVIELCRRSSMQRVIKGDLDAIRQKIGIPLPSGTVAGLTYAQVQDMIDDATKRHELAREDRIEEIFRRMGLWDEEIGAPDLVWVRERKRSADQWEKRKEQAGMAFALLIAGAILTWVISILGAGFKGWMVKAAASKAFLARMLV